MHHSQHFCHFLMHLGSLWGSSATSLISPRSSQLCQNGGLPILFSIGETVGWVGKAVMLFLAKNSLVKKEMWDGALSWCNSQFSRCQSSGRSLRTFLRSYRKTSQYYAKLAVWPARTSWGWSWLCSSPIWSFSVCPEPGISFEHPYTSHTSFPERLSNDSRVSVALFRDLHKIWCCFFVGFMSKSHLARYTTPNLMT
jgi:hypothetical protein